METPPIGTVTDETDVADPLHCDGIVSYAEVTLAPNVYLYYHAPDCSTWEDNPTFELNISRPRETLDFLDSELLDDIYTPKRIKKSIDQHIACGLLTNYADGTWDYCE